MTKDEVQRQQSNIEILEKEVELIDRKIDGLLKRKEIVKAAIAAQHAHFAPIRSLPSEILSEIFIWLTKFDPDGFKAHGTRATQVLLLLVCKKWRDIVLSLPALWSTFFFSIAKTYKAEDVAKFGRWLARSQPGTLDLNLYLDRHYYLSSSEAAQFTDVVLDTVAHHLQRCVRIHLSFSPRLISKLLFSQGNMFQRLRRLSLYSMSGFPSEPLHIDFANYPQLHTLHIVAYTVWDLAFRGVCPSLRGIEAASLTGDQTMNLLERCPSLMTCDLTSTANATFTGDNAVLQLSHLTTLTIRESADLVGKLLDRLSLPSLQVLTLVPEVNSNPRFTHEDPFHLSQFFRRSCPPLTELKLYTMSLYDFDETDLIASLLLVPTLRSLIVDGEICATDELFQALTMMEGNVHNNHSVLCPQLSELRIINSLRRKVSVNTVAEMVLSRSNVRNGVLFSCKPLAVLHLDCIMGIDAEQAFLRYPGLDRCIETGLDMKVNVRN